MTITYSLSKKALRFVLGLIGKFQLRVWVSSAKFFASRPIKFLSAPGVVTVNLALEDRRGDDMFAVQKLSGWVGILASRARWRTLSKILHDVKGTLLTMCINIWNIYGTLRMHMCASIGRAFAGRFTQLLIIKKLSFQTLSCLSHHSIEFSNTHSTRWSKRYKVMSFCNHNNDFKINSFQCFTFSKCC